MEGDMAWEATGAEVGSGASLVQLRKEDGGVLSVFASLADLREGAPTGGAVLVSMIEGSPIERGSLAAILHAYKVNYGKDLMPQIVGQLVGDVDREREIVSDEGFNSRIRLIPLAVDPCSLFASLWVVMLPPDFGQNSLIVLYDLLRRNMKRIITVGDGTLVMPLLGVHPLNRITPVDVMEEVVSMLVYCSAHVTELSHITIYMHAESLKHLEHQLKAPEWQERQRRGEPASLEDSGSVGILRDLLPENIGDNMTLLGEVLSQPKAEGVDTIMQDICAIILSQWRLCEGKVGAADVSLLLASTVCMQARRLLERYCRMLSGDLRMNAGFKDVSSLAERGAMPQVLAEGAMKLIRNGNKAAHTDIGVGSLTLSDANLSLLCVISILHQVIEHPVVIPPTPLFGLSQAHGAATMFPGDWMCKCGEHNFAVRTACRACSSPKEGQQPPQHEGVDVVMTTTTAPTITTTFAPPPTMLPGDWLCKGCGSHNFAIRNICRDCSRPKDEEGSTPLDVTTSTPTASHLLPGDWLCKGCGDHNFAARSICRGCGSSKDTTTTTITAAPSLAHSPTTTTTTTTTTTPIITHGGIVLPGDWICKGCGGHNFASRSICRGCGSHCRDCLAPKDTPGTTPTPTTTTTTITPITTHGGNVLPGDWICKGCGGHNFAVRIACRGCAAPKEEGTTITTTTTTATPTTAPPAHLSGLKSGDWRCPHCSAHNFASRQACFGCSRPRPPIDETNTRM